MAIDLSFLGGLPEGLLTPEQMASAQDRAQRAAALQLGLGMVAGAQGQRGQGRPRLGQIVAQAGGPAMQAYQGAFDQTLRNALVSMQLGEAKRKQEQETRIQDAIQQYQQQLQNISGGVVTPTMALSGGGGPTTAVAERIGQPINAAEEQRRAAIQLLSKVSPQTLAAESLKGPDYLTVGENVFIKKPGGGLEKIVSSGGKFTGDFANYAIGLYRTADANEILSKDPDAMSKIEQGVLAKARAGAMNLPSGEERKAGFLANRVKFNLDLMSDIIKKNPPAASPEAIPSVVRYLSGSEFLSNKLTTTDRQRVEAAQRDVLDAALTLGTGAAYTREQLEGYRLSYFPQLSDDAATVKDKQARLQNLLESSYITAGRAAPSVAPARAPAPPQPATTQPAPTPSAAGKAPPGVPQNLWNLMDPAERALWQSK
jgi:hypothetical protein